MRVFEIDAIELMSGEVAPVGQPDPRGVRTCRLRLHAYVSGDIDIEPYGEGPVEGVPTSETAKE